MYQLCTGYTLNKLELYGKCVSQGVLSVGSRNETRQTVVINCVVLNCRVQFGRSNLNLYHVTSC